MPEIRVADGVTPSFHQGVIAYHDRTVAVVGDRTLPLVAVAEPRVVEGVGALDAGPLTFLDVPDLSRALEAGFRPADWPHLTVADVRYSRPATAGEALCNYWD